MKKVVLNASVGRGVVVLDEKDKPLTCMKKYRGREQKVTVTDHAFHRAGDLVELPDDEADELLGRGVARHPDPVLDASVDELS